tara:strand:- start:16936 stop:17712 length:777 start_codon:yes stop_codon:yes gene_type:complete
MGSVETTTVSRKEKNVRIFNDTIEIVEELNVQGHSNTFKYTFDNISKDVGKKEGNVFVLPDDTITTTMLQNSERVCMLNMASPKTAGGGVKRGSVAQEECLFRCTNLYQTITQDFYPLETSEALYTKDAIIVKDRHYVPLQTPFKTDCITIAAINLNGYGRSLGSVPKKDRNYTETMKQKIRLMLSLPYHNGCGTLVLGSWGCGVFDNKPSEVAQMFYEVLVTEGMRYLFNNVVFGVINDNNSVGNNFQIFQDRLNEC